MVCFVAAQAMEQEARVAGGDCASDDVSGIASVSGASDAVVHVAAAAATVALAELDGGRARGMSGSGAERASGVRDDARSAVPPAAPPR